MPSPTFFSYFKLSYLDDFEKASLKLKKSEEFSDIATTDNDNGCNVGETREKSRRRIRRKNLSSSSDEDVLDCYTSLGAQGKGISRPPPVKLPSANPAKVHSQIGRYAHYKQVAKGLF